MNDACDIGDNSPERPVVAAAEWASAVMSLRQSAPDPLPGIVSPLRLSGDFASNTQSDAASVTFGNGVVRLSGNLAVKTSGELTLSYRWTEGYSTLPLIVGADVEGWTVRRVDANRIDLTHPARAAGEVDARVPALTIVKPTAVQSDDEFTVRVHGADAASRADVIRGWAQP